MKPLADIVAARKITRVVHVHTDHWEPEDWLVSGRQDFDRLEQYLDTMGPARLSAFVKWPLVARLAGESRDDGLVSYDPADPIEFAPFSQHAAMGRVIQLLDQAGADLHVHIHHELWTLNQCHRDRLLPDRAVIDGTTAAVRSRVLQGTPTMDGRRFSRVLGYSLDLIEFELGRQIRPCGFIHGCWALAASDPTVCTIMDELERLYGQGIVADFSFPAGRRHCDSYIHEPFTVLPFAQGVKAFDRPAAEQQRLSGEGATWPQHRLLIWNADRNGWYPSLDFKSVAVGPEVPHLTERIHRHLLLDVGVIRGTAVIKTHAHSMSMVYLQPDGYVSPLSQFAPELRRLGEMLSDVGVELVCWTVRQLCEFLRGGSPLA